MSECRNMEVKDLLPDAVSGALDDVALQMVEAHVALCTECAAEMELLRSVRRALRTPIEVRIDTARIAAAIAAQQREAAFSVRWWRVAAAIAILALGSGGALLRMGQLRTSVRAPDEDTVTITPAVTPSAAAATAPDTQKAELAASTPKRAFRGTARAATFARRDGVTLGLDVSAINPDDLSKLIKDLRTKRVDPPLDPESVLPVVALGGY